MTGRAALNWARLVAEQRLSGLPALLACYCSVLDFNPDKAILKLELYAPLQPLAHEAAIAALAAKLAPKLGADLRIEMVYGDSSASPAKQAQDRRVEAFARALAGLREDPRLLEMVTEFDGKIDIDSIVPAGAPTWSPVKD